MDVLQLLKCVGGSHHRSRSLAWKGEDNVYRSWCTGCNKPMIRPSTTWLVDRAPVPPPAGHRRTRA